jgi:hypothetical protein
MTVEVETSVQLNISGAKVTGTAGSGTFAGSFGSVNGLGLSPAANVTAAIDSSGATCSTPITITPIYTGFVEETADVTVKEGASNDQIIAREGATANGMLAVTTSVAAFSNVISGSSNQRFVVFCIARTEAAGTKTPTLVYMVTIN